MKKLILISLFIFLGVSCAHSPEAPKGRVHIPKKDSATAERRSKKSSAQRSRPAPQRGIASVDAFHYEAAAEKHFAAGRYQQAVDALAKDADRLSEQGYLTLAASYSELKEYDNELRILGLLSTKKPQDFRWYMLIGQAHLKKSRLAKELDAQKAEETLAIQNFRNALKANSKFKPAYDQMIEIFLVKGENHEARELMIEALNQVGDRPEWLNTLCRLTANDGFLAQAEEMCERAIRVSPASPENYVFLTQALLDMNDSEKTQKAQKVARNSGGRFPASEFAQWGAGKVFLLAKNYEAAIKYFGNAIHANAKSMRAHLGQAEAMFNSGDRDRALGHYRESCKLGSKYGEKLHVRSAESRMKGDEALSLKYRSLAEVCD